MSDLYFDLPEHHYHLVPVASGHRGRMVAYRNIQSQVFAPMFAREGRKFNPLHPDHTRADNEPLVLYYRGYGIGAARLDLLPSPLIKAAAIRLVAIRYLRQRKGYGRILMERLEKLARERDIALLLLNAHDEPGYSAVGFYEKLGYTACSWEDPAGSKSNRVQMGKLLRPRSGGL